VEVMKSHELSVIDSRQTLSIIDIASCTLHSVTLQSNTPVILSTGIHDHEINIFKLDYKILVNLV